MSTENEIRDDEFDIELIAQKLYRITRKIFHKMLFPFRVLFRKPVRLIAFMLAAVIASGILFLFLPKVYESSFNIRPANSSDLDVINLVWDIKTLVERNEVGILASQLKLSTDDAKAVKRIVLEPVWKNQYPDGKYRKDTLFLAIIRIRTTRPELFDTIQNHLISWLENSTHYALIRTLRQQNNLAMKAKIDNELREIDSLKHLMAQNIMPRNAGGLVYGEPLDPVRIYDASALMFKQKLGLQWESEYLNNFELMKPCLPSSKPVSPDFLKLLAFCASLALILCFVYNLKK